MITFVGCLLNVSRRFNCKDFLPYPKKNEASFHHAADCQTYLNFLKSSNCTRVAEISGKPYYLNIVSGQNEQIRIFLYFALSISNYVN